jgi:PAS domain S-box-containing protein
MNNKKEREEHRRRDETRMTECRGHEAELRFQSLFEQSPFGIVIINTRGKIIEFNKTAHEDHGYSREEFAKLDVFDIDPFQDPRAIRANLREVLKKGEAAFEVKHRSKDGRIRDVHVIAQVVNLSGKRVFQAIWHDITERKRTEKTLREYREHLEHLVKERTAELSRVNNELQRDIFRRKMAEARLRESEERFRGIFEDGPLGMIILKSGDTIVNANKSFCDMMGGAEPVFEGNRFLDIIHPEDQRRMEELFQQLVRGEIPLFQFEHRIIKKDGEYLWVNSVTTALQNEDSTLIHALSMIQDISDRKLAEQKQAMLIQELQDAMAKIKLLRGLLPMCAWCKKIRDDNGYWKKVETYIEEHSDVSVTHGICPECLKKNDPETYEVFGAKIARECKKERRKSERLILKEPFSCVASLQSWESEKTVFKATVYDFSEDGACLRTDYPVDVNAELSFSRGLEDKAGVVKWREKISEENRYRIGVRFLKQ